MCINKTFTFQQRGEVGLFWSLWSECQKSAVSLPDKLTANELLFIWNGRKHPDVKRQHFNLPFHFKCNVPQCCRDSTVKMWERLHTPSTTPHCPTEKIRLRGIPLCNPPAMQHKFNNKSLAQILCDHIAAKTERERKRESERESQQLWVFVSLLFPPWAS